MAQRALGGANRYDEENESKFILPDESIRVENKEEAENAEEEGTAHADVKDDDSHLMRNDYDDKKDDADDDSHHNMCRAKFLSEFEGGCFILKRDDPSVQWQRDYGCHT